jgi:hypothetical protein
LRQSNLLHLPPPLPVSSKIAEKTRIGASYNLKTGPVKHRDVRHGFVLGHPMIHAGIFERYFDFVSCLILSFLSAASLANRRSFSRAVFARTAWPAASYSDMAFVASVARSSFCVRFNWASASVRFFEWLAMIAPIRHRTAIRPVMFG